MLACVDVRALPLQLVWRAEPTLASYPLVIVERDHPQGAVLWACEHARKMGVLPGARYGHALVLCSELRARVVPPEQLTAAVDALRDALHAHSPRVEADRDRGTFWLDGDGLARVTGTRMQWAVAIQSTVTSHRLRSAIVVGMSRFATYALARAGAPKGIMVFETETEERAAACKVPLVRLDIAPKLYDALARLGVTTLGEFVRLPGGGILERFGSDAYRLYQLAADERWDPLVPAVPPEHRDELVLLDDDLDGVDPLMFVLNPAVARVVARLGACQRAVEALHIELVLRRAVGDTTKRVDCIKPATPTLDVSMLMRLAYLRYSGAPAGLPVHAVRVWADDVLATREQLKLFVERPRRDLRAANAALASIRAELGEDVVARAVLRDAHLPEASFGWERLDEVVRARPQPKLIKPLVRRLFTRPRALAQRSRDPRPRDVRDGWLLADLEMGPVKELTGPFMINGGWWSHHEVQREYHYALMRRGDWLWVFYDAYRRRWYWQGVIQ